ncbi:gluconate 2-dehydrogenase subunit 3 family protein [Tunicatimonas pelagia]|uniref:gluconate 2-dehydrogenase subunit 3 family protein n=1 Tax=Tunicatimonas pelagia TaxID=931531 RepID=UPI0026663830|nr:gluconate 2-dehydrogenase subunit 3 family protein [Tunicatimonas pelagia]WKN41837.1 gluconate 2-dehydrogenase subunit 3 family protein [Tunicatimonas pelagia]
MDRRESMKTMLVGSLAGGLVIGCTPEEEVAEQVATPVKSDAYGRTEEEKLRDELLHEAEFFTEAEVGTIATLCDLILPATDKFGSATDAGVPEFIAFIAKDITEHQLPLRGGLMWLNHRAIKKFSHTFDECTPAQQTELLDEIAYPDKATPEVAQGVTFFNRMRNLTLTGYYTSKMGIEELGYQGNRPNVWDGVPDDVLKEHGMAYDEEWLAKCIDQETRDVMAEWDDDGNLLT